MTTDREVFLTTDQRSELSSIAQSRSLPAGYAFRAKLVLMLAEGASFNTIKRTLQTSSHHHPLETALPRIRARWARYLSSRSEDYRSDSGVASSDFVGHAEETHGRFYVLSCRKLAAARHGTLSLDAALDTQTGRLYGKTATRHTSGDFVAFLEEVVSLCPPRQQIHIILDNLSDHKTQPVRDFLEKHPRVQFHFTPTYSSWLNQVEIWFAKIEREVIARGIFTSVPDLARKLRRYINAYSANARPIQWKYSNPSHRLRTNEFTATVY